MISIIDDVNAGFTKAGPVSNSIFFKTANSFSQQLNLALATPV